MPDYLFGVSFVPRRIHPLAVRFQRANPVSIRPFAGQRIALMAKSPSIRYILPQPALFAAKYKSGQPREASVRRSQQRCVGVVTRRAFCVPGL